jgi:hypothetical protein
VKCETCASQRWLMFAARWKDDKLAADWRPFDRGAWSFLAPTDLAASLATGTLKACPGCNPSAVAPWSRTWTTDAPTSAGGGADAPFKL